MNENFKKSLSFILKASEEEIVKKYELESINSDPNLYFKNNNSNILGVAHLDSVIEGGVHALFSEKYLFSQTLDDRLGVWILLEFLPKQFNIKLDWLLTIGEEIGFSSAQFFKSEKDYNWLVEFDRTGTDVVVYQYQEISWVNNLKKYFEKVRHGSYTDICDLDFLGVCGVNIGIGYYDYHKINAYANIQEMFKQLRVFYNFYSDFGNIKFPHHLNDQKSSSRKYILDDDRYLYDDVWDYDYYSGRFYNPRISAPKKEKTNKITKKETNIAYFCEMCGEEYLEIENKPVKTDDGYVVCRDCAKEYTWQCEICNRIFTEYEDKYNTDDMTLCSECYLEIIPNKDPAYCKICGILLDPDELESGVCKNCLEELKYN